MSNALCNRHGVKPPQPQFERLWFTDYLAGVYREIELLYVEEMVHWTTGWLAKWPLNKRKGILRSQEADEIRASDLHCMVKREDYIAIPTRARLIQYYVNPATQAEFGPQITGLQKALTKLFYKRFVCEGITVTFASGMNALELGQWMDWAVESCAQVAFYERDGKNWDATMQEIHLDLKMEAYKCAGEDLLKYVAAGYQATGRNPRGRFKYAINGTTKSGHNDTTLANTLNNAGIAVQAMRACGLRGHILVAGDDMLAVVDGDFSLDEMVAEEAKSGIKPEARKFYRVQDVSFISGIWFDTTVGHVFTPKPGRLLRKLFWTVKPPPPKHRARYLNGVVLGLLPVCAGMPVVEAFLRAHYTAGEKSTPGLSPREHWRVARSLDRSQMIGPFCTRYALTVPEVVALEESLLSHSGLVGIVRHPTIDKIVGVDLADLNDRPCY
jgi:hypothetical protein